MTSENIIQIKVQHKNWLIKGFLVLMLMLASLFTALLPLIVSFDGYIKTMLYIIGGVLFVIFTAIFVHILYKECKPDNALVLTAHGFTDNKNIGEGIEIEWTNVSSVKMMGKANMPFLGVTLENSDIILAQMKKKPAAEMRENIEQNLPTILIPQKDVRISINELKNLFTKFVREARVLKNDSPKKPKNNPFSTDDVLRAFGKLPENDKADEDIKSEHELPEKINDKEISQPFENPEQPLIDDCTGEKQKHVSASDSFYEALRAKAMAKSEAKSTKTVAPESVETLDSVINSTSQGDEMPEEIKELLSKAKSSRISELEKILSDTDVPYAASREEQKSDTSIEADIKTSDHTVDIEEAPIEDERLQDGCSEDTSGNEPFEVTLGSLIENALQADDENCISEESVDPIMEDIKKLDAFRDENTDTKEFIIGLSEKVASFDQNDD